MRIPKKGVPKKEEGVEIHQQKDTKTPQIVRRSTVLENHFSEGDKSQNDYQTYYRLKEVQEVPSIGLRNPTPKKLRKFDSLDENYGKFA